MQNPYSAELASMPLKYLSGDYDRSYIPQDALTKALSAVRAGVINRDITSARDLVKSNARTARENKSYTDEKSTLQAQLQAAEDDLANMEDRLELLIIQYNQRPPAQYVPYSLDVNQPVPEYIPPFAQNLTSGAQ